MRIPLLGKFKRHVARPLVAALKRPFMPRVCNICGWSGAAFVSDGWHPGTLCPGCGLVLRHRLLVAALGLPGPIHRSRTVEDKRILHFAAEVPLAQLLRKSAKEYRSADYLRDGFDLKLDLSAMPELKEGSVDALIACDVLEHVPEDARALREIHRVLSPGGWAILAVPQKDGLSITHEDPTVNTPERRLELFGQEDHVRFYGDDFAERVKAAGFDLTVIDAGSFSPADQKRYGLVPGELSEHPMATNHRKVFFARKGR